NWRTAQMMQTVIWMAKIVSATVTSSSQRAARARNQIALIQIVLLTQMRLPMVMMFNQTELNLTNLMALTQMASHTQTAYLSTMATQKAMNQMMLRPAFLQLYHRHQMMLNHQTVLSQHSQAQTRLYLTALCTQMAVNL